MLTAKLKNGHKLCLGYPYKKETLLSLRSKEEFFCPICGEKVILKLGDSKIYHFAHKQGGNCRDFYENETEFHMNGKLKLFQWLNYQRANPVLEYYDPTIQQRPDILFHFGNKTFALEFQCSHISQQVFRKRTEAYLARGYRPFWIIGNNLQASPLWSGNVSNYHFLFLRTSSNGQFYIPGFTPDENSFQFLSSIFPYYANKVFFRKAIFSIEKTNLSDLLEPEFKAELNMSFWKKKIEKGKFFWSLKPNQNQKSFLYEIYSHYLNLSLFPPEIGLPTAHGLILQTPPFIWQAYYYLDLLQKRLPGDVIHIRDMERCLMNRIKRNEITIRTLPQSKKQDPLFAFADYTYTLVRLGILSRKTREVFQVQKQMKIPVTAREQEELTNAFYRQNSKILLIDK